MHVVYGGTQQWFPPKYIEITLKAIQTNLYLCDMDGFNIFRKLEFSCSSFHHIFAIEFENFSFSFFYKK